jgi:hypothetical protein
MQGQRIFSIFLFSRTFATALALVILFGLFACTQNAESVKPLNIASDAKFSLLTPESFGQSLSLLQSLEINYSGVTRQLLAQLEITSNSITLVGLSPLGNRLFTVLWTGESLSEEYLDEWPFPFSPKHILADVQLALWLKIPQHDVLKIRDIDSPLMKREVLRNEKIIMRISYETRPFWQGKMIIEHLEREYKLSIQTLQSNQLP